MPLNANKMPYNLGGLRDLEDSAIYNSDACKCIRNWNEIDIQDENDLEGFIN